jgi:serine/threonine protein phosphatase 1
MIRDGSVMSDGRTFVVGDIHGCVDELSRLLDALAPGSEDTVCFLGDYVDRGVAPKAVIARVLRLRSEGPRCIFLKGNHEDMFLHYLGYPGHYGDAFLWNGGDVTLESYGIEYLAGKAAAERLPPDHLQFLLDLETRQRFGDFLCVHAGLRPTRSLKEQDEEDLFWIREEFIDRPHPFPFTILYGHTPQRDVRLHLPYKVGLDTGAVYGNLLSCLELESKELVQVATGTLEVVRRSLATEFAEASRVR